MFGSTEKTSQDQLIPVESLSLSTDTFERCLDALASETKWPVNYIRTERRRRECDRLALYLLGVVDTFMSDGPKRSTIYHFKRILQPIATERKQANMFSFPFWFSQSYPYHLSFN